MNAPFVIVLAMLALVALVVWAVRSLGSELRGLGDENGDQDRTVGTGEKTPAETLNERKWRANQ
jgi:hypothetical protein